LAIPSILAVAVTAVILAAVVQFGGWLVLVEQRVQMAMVEMEDNYLGEEVAALTVVLQAQVVPGVIIV
jgi:non-ribosomal peptide synthetase component E (peptide arylation enzyme)